MKTRTVTAAVVVLSVVLIRCDDTASKYEAKRNDSNGFVARTNRVAQERESKRHQIEEQTQVAEEKKAQVAWEHSKAGKVQKKHPEWPKEICIKVANGKIALGMTRDQVQAAWGRPSRINTTVTASGTHEQWVYHDDEYVYFQDGVMTGVQQSR